jgi:hypothetical protein
LGDQLEVDIPDGDDAFDAAAPHLFRDLADLVVGEDVLGEAQRSASFWQLES